MGRAKILFTSSLFTSFIKEDLALLRKHFDVDHLITLGPFAPFRIFARAARAELTFSWFASVYTFFVVASATIWGRHSVIVIGGVDVSRIPDIGYGIWLSRWKSMLVRWALRRAFRVIAVDPSLAVQASRLAEYDGKNIRWIPTGYDAEYWTPGGSKDEHVLTVMGVDDPVRARAKGIDFLFACALRMPETRFLLVGIGGPVLELLSHQAPSNIQIITRVDHDDLRRFYRGSKVYLQPSMTEGFPNSVCEAMLCACIPVGTTAGGIPTAIGEVGFLAPYGDVEKMCKALESALAASAEVGLKARDRIAREFTVERREAALMEIIREAV